MQKVFLALVATAAVALAVFLVLQLRTGPPLDDAVATEAPLTSAPAADVEAADAPEADAPSEPEPAPEPPAAESLSERAAIEADPLGLAEGPALDVLVFLPDAAPTDATLAVEAHGRALDHEALYRGASADDPDAATPEPLSRAVVDDAGLASLRVPADAEEVHLAVRGRFLYSRATTPVRREAFGEPVRLRPILGASLAVRVVPPPGEDAGALAGVVVEVTWDVAERRSRFLAEDETQLASLQLGRRPDANGSAVFGGVPAGGALEVHARSSSIARSYAEPLRLEPGEAVAIDLATSRGGTISGRVVDGDGAPVEGAEVDALGRAIFGNPTAELREATTDAEGRFELLAVSSGPVWVRARHDDFRDRLPIELKLAEGEHHADLEIELSRGLTLTGSVAFPDGTPVELARVQAEKDILAGGQPTAADLMGASGRDETDAEGRFEIGGLSAGKFDVRVRYEVEDDPEREAGVWNAREPAAHPEEDRPLAFVLQPPIRLAGVVRDAGGDPVAEYQVRATLSAGHPLLPPATSRVEPVEDEQGRFRLDDLSAGEWTIHVTAEGYAKPEPQTLELPAETTLEYVVERAGRVAGEVVDPGGAPVEGARVFAEPSFDERLALMQGQGDPDRLQARTDEAGRFELEGFPPGSSAVVAEADGFAESAAVGFELDAGEARSDLRLVLRRGGVISGEVLGRDGEPSEGTSVLVRSNDTMQQEIGQTDGEGRFRFETLRPGTWTVIAMFAAEGAAPGEEREMSSATDLSNLRIEQVELADGGAEHVVLSMRVDNPVAVTGRVTSGGDPVSPAVLTFIPFESEGISSIKIATVEADGTYGTELADHGAYQVIVKAVRSATGQEHNVEYTVEIPETDEHELDFELPLGRITGRVYGPDDQPLARARVTLNRAGGKAYGSSLGGTYIEAATDDAGRFELSYLSEGSYRVAAGGAILGGLLGDEAQGGRTVELVELRAGQSLEGMDFHLDAPGRIEGRVVDAGGSPVAGASVFARDAGGHPLELFTTVQTDGSGRFRYAGLAPGSYTVSAARRAGSDDDLQLASHETEVLRVAAGEATEVTLALEVGTLLLISLEDKSGETVPATLSVTDERGHEWSTLVDLASLNEQVTAGGAGIQSVGPVPPGLYSVRADAEDGRSTSRKLRIDGDRAEKKVKLRLRE